MLLQSQANEPEVGIGDRRPQRLRALEALALDGVAYGVGMDAQFRGNGADFPMFGVKVASNLRTGSLLIMRGPTFVVEYVEMDR